jgi:spermidine synthase
LVLYEHDGEFDIRVDGHELMSSRRHESELELARLGCAALSGRRLPCVLIGGLGLGYTLRQALDMLNSAATVVVGELVEAVVEWNRRFLGELNDHPLEDERVALEIGDVVDLVSRSENRFDAILLDIDNGPHALTAPGNRRLYGRVGIDACRRALRKQGCLSVWSPEPNKRFERRLMNCGLHVRRYRVPAYKGSKSQSCFVWVASEDKRVLPAGGGEPRLPPKNTSKESGRRGRRRR